MISSKQEAMAETLLKVTTMVSKLQDKIDDIENKVSDHIYVGGYNQQISITQKRYMYPQKKKLLIKFKQKKARAKK